MENSTVSIDRKRFDKLSVVERKAGMSKTEIVSRYIDALAQLIEEARPDSAKISLTDFELDLKLGIMKQGFANLFDITELPLFIQNFYALQKLIEDGEARNQFFTKEQLLAKGFNEADIDLLLEEQKRRFKK